MSSPVAATYFQPQKGGFWEWSKEDEVITWTDGKTICYVQDLLEILKSLQHQGLPPIEVVLLVIAACQREWHTSGFSFECINNQTEANSFEFEQIKAPQLGVIHSIKQNKFLDLKIKWSPTLDFLKRIHALPAQLRTGYMRMHLMQRIFSQYSPKIAPEEARFFIKAFESGVLEKGTMAQSNYDLIQELYDVFLPLFKIKDLETYIRTGLKNNPEPVQFPVPETAPDDLLTQLSQDHQTAGLVRLTKRLIAALNIPPHTQGASDQPLGGVSDISNRGNFDRLLLSELANDDDTLSARLVNNEALYLRRETPPDPQVQERVILVDNSLRLWGMPRVFAVSAALGCALNNHHKAGISAFALGKEIIGPNALATKEEVVHFLEQQSPVLHSGEALRTFFRQQPRTAQRAVFFITSEEVMADKNFSLIFAEQQQHLDYLLVLSRKGTLWFYKLANGQRSLMSTSVFDLEELLFEPKKSAMLAALVGALGRQAEHSIKHLGLFLPSYPGEINREDVAYDGTVLVAVLPSRRVWFWHSPQKGAIELLDKIEEGGYSFYLVDHELKCIIVTTKDHKFMAYLFENNGLSAVVDLYAKLIRYHPQLNVVNLQEIDGQVVACGYTEGNLFIGLNQPGNPNYAYLYKNITHVIDLKAHTITPLPEKRAIPKEHLLPNLHPVKKMVNNGYSVLRNVKEIGFTADGFIQLGGYRIILRDDKLWLVQASRANVSMNKYQSQASLDNQFYTRTFEWPNGCKITLDSRGYLSFVSVRPYNNFYIVLIIGQELAAFSTRDHYTGNPYFYTTSSLQHLVSPTHFYKRFILEFINAIAKP